MRTVMDWLQFPSSHVAHQYRYANILLPAAELISFNVPSAGIFEPEIPKVKENADEDLIKDIDVALKNQTIKSKEIKDHLDYQPDQDEMA